MPTNGDKIRTILAHTTSNSSVNSICLQTLIYVDDPGEFQLYSNDGFITGDCAIVPQLAQTEGVGDDYKFTVSGSGQTFQFLASEISPGHCTPELTGEPYTWAQQIYQQL